MLQACDTTKVSKGTIVVTKVPKNETVVQPELCEFLKNKPKPSIVLRVPMTKEDVTTTEAGKIDKYSSVYGRIERELMKAGYIVRDRSLLNEVLASGKNVSYQEIGEKIQTDIILEIISIAERSIDKNSFDIQTEYKYPRSYQVMHEDTDIEKDLKSHVNIINYVIDCKIILVKSGTTVGMSTFNYCNCNKNLNGICNLNFKVTMPASTINPSSIRIEGGDDSKWYMSMTWIIELEYLSERLANDLIKIFKGQ